jgi:cellulose synthase/poly-beta-1,6-N-acetylglucosamine synthase-like glycosyltransferase
MTRIAILLQILFWSCLFLLWYTYFGYPLLLRVLVKVRRRRPIQKKTIFPKVSIVIAAHNEEQSIAEKLNNVLSLEYPREKMEVVVASDFSTDRTDEIVRGFADKGVRLIRSKQRSGKIGAYRTVYPELNGEIIIFSDATSILDKHSVTALISNFNDSTVGCAAGLLRYDKVNQAAAGEGEGTYWKYEKPILMNESSLASLTSVSGTFYAVYKHLFPHAMAIDLADDFIVPLTVVEKGYRAVLEPEAVCREHAIHASEAEISKRSRITLQNIRGLFDQKGILNVFQYGLFSLMVISHKLCRILVPIFLIGLFLSNAALAFDLPIFQFLLAGQGVFYLTGSLGHLVSSASRVRLINSIFFFCLSNMAILFGIIKFFIGSKVVTWEPARFN